MPHGYRDAEVEIAQETGNLETWGGASWRGWAGSGLAGCRFSDIQIFPIAAVEVWVPKWRESANCGHSFPTQSIKIQV